MSLIAHLREAPNDAVALKAYERRQAIGDAIIEAALYQAGVPERFFKGLFPALRGTSRPVLNSALILYQGLEEDLRLDEKARVQLIPSLVELVNAHGSLVFEDDQYLNEVVEGYLSQGSNGPNQQIVSTRIRDVHTKSSQIPYGSKDSGVVYGSFRIKPNGKLEQEYSPRFGYSPFRRQMVKLEELMGVVSTSNPNWKRATELLMDLRPGELDVFPGNHSFYMTLVSTLGTIIKRRIPVRLSLLYIDNYVGESRIPIGYIIVPYRGESSVPNESENPTSAVTSSDKPNFVNRPAIAKKIGKGTKTGTNVQLVVANRPPRPLEKRLAQIRL